MKKKFLKLLTCIVFCGTLLLSVIFCAGCYVVKGVKMSKLVGTYELTRYHGDEDYIARDSMELYIVIKNDGKGYYVYKDKDTPLHCGEITCRFTTNQEDSSIYDYVEILFSQNVSEYHKLAINGKNLNSQKTKWKPINKIGDPLEIDYYIDVDFMKVDNATDLSYLEDTFDRNFTVQPQGAFSKIGLYKFLYFEDHATGSLISEGVEDPVYAYIQLNPYENKALVYYMLKSDEVQVEREYTCSFVYDGENFVANIGEKSCTIEWTGMRVGQPNTEPAIDWVFVQTAVGEVQDLTETIAQAVADYQASKMPQA